MHKKQKTENLMTQKSNLVIEHLQIYGVLRCAQAQIKTLKRTSTIQYKLPTSEQIERKL
jgi:hypothetical protein